MYKGRVYFHCGSQVVCLTKDLMIQILSSSSGMNHLLVVFVLAILLSTKHLFLWKFEFLLSSNVMLV